MAKHVKVILTEQDAKVLAQALADVDILNGIKKKMGIEFMAMADRIGRKIKSAKRKAEREPIPI